MKPTIIHFNRLGDERGSLIAIEAEQSIPFPVKRVYYIYGTKSGVSRGFHAHKDLQQVAIAVSGSCEMLLDDGTEKSTVLLNSPEKGLLIGPGVWREIRNFTKDCVLLVLTDKHYDEADYMRDYEIFLKWRAK